MRDEDIAEEQVLLFIHFDDIRCHRRQKRKRKCKKQRF